MVYYIPILLVGYVWLYAWVVHKINIRALVQ